MSDSSTLSGTALEAKRIAVRSAVSGAPAPLGTVAKSVSPRRGIEAGLTAFHASASGARRFFLQAAARSLLSSSKKWVKASNGDMVEIPAERVCHCLRTPTGREVEVWRDLKHAAAHYKQLIVCGSVWTCAVCAARISEVRREELSTAIKAWPGQIVLITLTLQHSASDSLSGLLEALLEAVRKMRQGKGWQLVEERYGVEFESRGRVRPRIGTIRALECTSGDHGFHPHLHLLGFLRGGVDVEAFTRELRGRWLSAVAKVGRYAHPKWGIDVRHTDAEIADYVAKWGKAPKWTAAHELAKLGIKLARGENFTMAGLLEVYAIAGDGEAGRRWREYARCFKGKHQLVWSDGLRALLLPDQEEKTDEEIVNTSEEESVFLASLDLEAWRVVLAHDARFELLQVASAGDVAQLESFVLSLGITEGVFYAQGEEVALSP